MSQLKNGVFKRTITSDVVGKNVRSYNGLSSINGLGAGDSFYVHDFVNRNDVATIFAKLIREIDFVPMFNVSKDRDEIWPIPRLVSAQTFKSECKSPIYRMPGCNQANISTSRWSETVRDLSQRAERVINAELNHCVCTLYRDQNDSLGFHKDKMLDLAENSLILSLSFGAARPILIHEIDGRSRHVVMLQPGSLLAIGPETNKSFEHGIPKLRSEVGPRISLSLRQSASYVGSESGEIVGKGEEHQTAHYPFIESFDDSNTYSSESQQAMVKFQKDATDQIETMRASL